MVGMGKYLNNISILMVHGTEDHMVDLHHSMLLAKVCKKNAKFVCLSYVEYFRSLLTIEYSSDNR